MAAAAAAAAAAGGGGRGDRIDGLDDDLDCESDLVVDGWPKSASLARDIGKLYGGWIRGAAEASECCDAEGHIDFDLVFKDDEARPFDDEAELKGKVQRMCKALQVPFPSVLGYSLWHDLWKQCKRVLWNGDSALFRLVKRGRGRPRIPKPVTESGLADGYTIRVATDGMFVVFRGYAPPPSDSDTAAVADLVRKIESYGFHLRVHDEPRGTWWRRWMTDEEAAEASDPHCRDRIGVLSRDRVSDAVMHFAARCRLREGHTFAM